LFFSFSFVILFLVSTGLRFLVIRAEWVRSLSLQHEAVLPELIVAARWALSLALYGGVLLGLSYSVRREVFALQAILCVALLSIGFTYGINLGLKNWEYVPPARIPAQPLGGPGLILSNTVQPSDTALVLLQGPAEPGGRRVVATPGIPLLYQAETIERDPSFISLPPAPFNLDSPWFLKSLAIDLRLNAENLRQRLDEGLLPFLLYTGALIILLTSLIFIADLSMWPLANLFLGGIAFRGVLALETFLNSPEIQYAINAFLHGTKDTASSGAIDSLPLSFAVPLIFSAVGALIHLYSFLVYISKKRGKYAA